MDVHQRHAIWRCSECRHLQPCHSYHERLPIRSVPNEDRECTPFPRAPRLLWYILRHGRQGQHSLILDGQWRVNHTQICSRRRYLKFRAVRRGISKQYALIESIASATAREEPDCNTLYCHGRSPQLCCTYITG